MSNEVTLTVDSGNAYNSHTSQIELSEAGALVTPKPVKGDSRAVFFPWHRIAAIVGPYSVMKSGNTYGREVF